MMRMKFDVLQKHPRQARTRFTRRARAIGASPLEAPKIGVQAVIVGSDARALTVHGDTRVSLRHDLAAPDLRKPALPHCSFGDHYGEASASAAEKQEGILVGSWRLFQ